MNNFAADTQIAPKVAKSSGVHDEGTQGGFDALMAGLIAPAPVQPQTQTDQTQTDQTEADQSKADQTAAIGQNTLISDADAADVATQSAATPAIAASTDTQNGSPTATLASVSTQSVAAPGQSTTVDGSNAVVASADSTSPIAQADTGIATAASASQGASAALISQLSALTGTKDTAAAETLAPPTAAPASTTAPSKSIGAAGQNGGAASATQTTDGASEPSSSGAQANTTQSPATPQPQSGVETNKAKPLTLETEAAGKPAAKSTAPAILTSDLNAPQTALGEATAMPTDQTSRPPQLTPHTIPMLAATMMRRLESGSKQFSMRLDPPELGQVEVKLTVDADKKVRAVISADRPEALADLVRSARELTRALHDAGLDLEDNGLTFTLNDPAGDQSKNGQSRSQQSAGAQKPDLKLVAETLNDQGDEAPTHTPNDPFQSWQRARIAISA